MPKPSPKSKTPVQKKYRFRLLIAGFCIAAIIVGAALLIRYWPFSRDAMLQLLSENTDSQVTVGSFQETYFPSPGCVLQDVVFNHDPAAANPFITIKKLTIQGSYRGLLARRVPSIVVEGLRIAVPALGTGRQFHIKESHFTIDELMADGAVIEYAAHASDHRQLLFEIHQATMRHAGWFQPFSFAVKIHNPEPSAELSLAGMFGTWKQSDAGATPISGHYILQDADLSIYRGIAGTFSSAGSFGGSLSHIEITGTTDAPDFAIRTKGHAMRLTAQFSASLDMTRGNAFLQHADIDFLKTQITAMQVTATQFTANGGTAKPEKEESQTTSIDLTSTNARIQDILRLLITSDSPPMSGWVTFRGRAEIPSGTEEFLKRVRLRGEFGIAAGTFGNSSTQRQIDKLSAGARGEKTSDAGLVLSNLKGRESLADGVATFSDISFHVPGADATMRGTYNVIRDQIDLHGQLRVDTKIANTKSGVKNLALKVIQPFFKKNRNGQIVPVRISGTYDHPAFGLDIGDKRAQTPTPPKSSQ
ncbi:MAG TPA: AsmA-like C-terminal region-containing protein [Candidatus Aquilonibacter sp.]|nr:AsmA-like C-terminal region-containing protein [Candidatus Aquilonibacter sp.]